MDEYIPLGVRSGAIDSEVLHEGVPVWLSQSVKDWVDRTVRVLRRTGLAVSEERLRAIERHCRFALDWSPSGEYSALSALKRMADVPGQWEQFLWAVDYLCSVAEAHELKDLEAALKQGGSAWRVSTVGVPQLERRVPEAVVEAAEAVMTGAGEAGKLLTEAWQALYGMNPDLSEAYRHAVRAIEAACHDTVIPDNPRATLGTMITAMRDKPSKWAVRTEGDHPVETLIGMMETVWTGQTDRHGEKRGIRALVDGAAELAVQIAVALVALFASGAVRRTE